MANISKALTYDLESILTSTSRITTDWIYSSPSNVSVYNLENIDFKNVENFKENSKSLPDKTYCSWCHGETFDDIRGHCIACGAPRGGGR